jgi:hypothetical protein
VAVAVGQLKVTFGKPVRDGNCGTMGRVDGTCGLGFSSQGWAPGGSGVGWKSLLHCLKYQYLTNEDVVVVEILGRVEKIMMTKRECMCESES